MFGILNKIKRMASAKLIRSREKQAFQKNTELRETYNIFKNSPEGGWIIGPNDAVALYDLISRLKPKNILELGSGIGASTSVIALAAPEAKILAMEQFEKCVKLARELIPKNLQSHITLVHSPAIAWKDDRISPYQYLSVFQNIPENFGPFDFVLIDGPGYWLEKGQLIELPNGDLIRLLPRLAPGCQIYIDGRRKAVELYQRYLSEYVRIIHEDSENKYTVFEHTATPLKNLDELKIRDRLLEQWQKSTYFK